MSETYPLGSPLIVLIEYRRGNLWKGTFDSIPDDAYGAKIECYSPVINPEGNIVNNKFEYDLYVGERKKTDTLQGEPYADLKRCLIQNGVEEVVITQDGPHALKYGDKVFKTREEMVEAIGKIAKARRQVMIIRTGDEQAYENNEEKKRRLSL